MTLFELCKELRNFFDRDTRHTTGTFTIEEGSIIDDLSAVLKDGQYFRVTGSDFNDDAVFRYPASDMTDEVFYGSVRAMAIPRDVIALLDDINTWETKYGDTMNSPYVSESFGGYTYTKKAESGASTSGWQSAFASRLNKWRKI